MHYSISKVLILPFLFLGALTMLLLYTYTSVRNLEMAQTTQVQENLHEVIESIILDAMTVNINEQSRRDSGLKLDEKSLKTDIKGDLTIYLKNNYNGLLMLNNNTTVEYIANELTEKIKFTNLSHTADDIAKDNKHPTAELEVTKLYYKTISSKSWGGLDKSHWQETNVSAKVEIKSLLGGAYMGKDKDQRDTHTVIRGEVNSNAMGSIKGSFNDNGEYNFDSGTNTKLDVNSNFTWD